MINISEDIMNLRHDGWVIKLFDSGEVIGVFDTRQNASIFAAWYFGGYKYVIEKI